jgi:multicomponent Na+:H+ antiporter subunit C
VGNDGRLGDPVPQALILTAIVIGFALVSFLLAVAYRAWTISGNDQVEDDIEDRRLAAARRARAAGQGDADAPDPGPPARPDADR